MQALLPKAVVDERFNFFGKELSGTSQLRPRWQRGVFLVNGLVGDEVGKVLRASVTFSPEAKAQVQEIGLQHHRRIPQAHRKRSPGWIHHQSRGPGEAQHVIRGVSVIPRHGTTIRILTSKLETHSETCGAATSP